MTDQATQDAPTDASHRPAVAGQVERSVMRPVECRTVAALYVEPKGCYVGVPGVLESQHAAQNTRSQKSVSRRISSLEARKGQADNGRLACQESRSCSSKREGVERKERRQVARIQGRIPRKEPGCHSRGSESVARSGRIQRSSKRERRERAAATSTVWIDARVLRADVGGTRGRVRHLPGQRPWHETRKSSLRRSLPHQQPSARPSLSSMQHHARRGTRSCGNIALGGCLS